MSHFRGRVRRSGNCRSQRSSSHRRIREAVYILLLNAGPLNDGLDVSAAT